MRLHVHGTLVELLQTDLSSLRADAIVNAANEALAGGGGVDGALHRAAGPALSEACRALPFVRPGVRCPTGEVRSTRAGHLPADWVIHAVGPIWDEQEPERSAQLLGTTYRAALTEALRLGCRSVALPSLSTGAYRFPVPRASQVAMQTLVDVLVAHPGQLERVVFALFAEADRRWFERRFREIAGVPDFLGPVRRLSVQERARLSDLLGTVEQLEDPVVDGGLMYVVYAPPMRDLLQALSPLVVPFPWMEWEERRRLQPADLAGRPVEDAMRMLTSLVRAERFSVGTLAQALERGLLQAVVRRILSEDLTTDR